MTTRLGTAAALALVLALASACSDDGPRAAPGPSESPSSSEPAPTPTVTAPPSVEPATGAEVRIERLAMRAPEGWTVTEEEDPFSAQVGMSSNSIYLQELQDFGGGTLSLGEMAQTRLRNGPYLRKPKIVASVTVAGQDWFHISGRATDTKYAEDFGTVVDGLALLVAMSFELEMPAAERQQIVESVLASVTFD